MAELREYQVVLNGNQTIMRLDEVDAERLGATPVDQGKQSTTSTEAQRGESASGKARSASNKARGSSRLRPDDE